MAEDKITARDVVFLVALPVVLFGPGVVLFLIFRWLDMEAGWALAAAMFFGFFVGKFFGQALLRATMTPEERILRSLGLDP